MWMEEEQKWVQLRRILKASGKAIKTLVIGNPKRKLNIMDALPKKVMKQHYIKVTRVTA